MDGVVTRAVDRYEHAEAARRALEVVRRRYLRAVAKLLPCATRPLRDLDALLPNLEASLLRPGRPSLEVTLLLEPHILLLAHQVLQPNADAAIDEHELTRRARRQQVAVRACVVARPLVLLGRLTREVVEEGHAPPSPREARRLRAPRTPRHRLTPSSGSAHAPRGAS